MATMNRRQDSAIVKAVISELRLANARINLNGDNLELIFDNNNSAAHESLLEKVRLHKADIIAFLKERSGKSRPDPIPVAPPALAYPLSSAQYRLWILSQFEQDRATYNMPAAYVLEGSLDIRALSAAFNALILRHEILRTVFRVADDSDVQQVILPAEVLAPVLQITDLRQHPHSDVLVKQALTQDFSGIFDLAAGPLLRAALYQVADDKWIFSYVMHHIISDGWSMRILIKELLQLYRSSLHRETAALTALNIQYKDYTIWQRGRLQQTDMAQHKAYWLEQLTGALPVLNCAGDQLRPPVKTYRGSSVSRKLPAPDSQHFKALCHEQKASLFIGLLSIVNILFYRYTEQDDIIVGTPIAGREHPDLEGQIGFYINTLALRNRFKGTDSFRVLLGSVRQVVLDAYAHQAYPFDELIEALHIQRDISRNPLFDVLVTLQDSVLGLVQEAGINNLAIRNYPAEDDICKFDLTFDFSEEEDHIVFHLGYNSDIYSRPWAEQLSGHFEQLLHAITANPDLPLDDLDYLSAGEQYRIQQQFNGAGTALQEPEGNIVTWFESQATATPDHIALVFKNIQLSYRELDVVTDSLAAYLQQDHGLTTGIFAGIQLERSEWLIIAMLAILKCGAAYVPVDPAYPQERINFILADSQCKMLIDEQVIGMFRQQKEQFRNKKPVAVIRKEDLAYVIYTSGSTGRPKGVLVGHRSIALFAADCKTRYAAEGNIIMPLLASVSFDISLFELLLPLLSGGTAILTGNDEIRDIAVLCQKLQQATAIHAVPALMAQLLLEIKATGTAQAFSGVKDLFIGGDAVPTATLSAMRSVFPAARINVLYGPTEATIFVTSNRYLPGTETPFKGASLGFPHTFAALSIRDARQHLVPVGVTGEICIGGPVLAKGYLNQAELTEEKFIAVPRQEGYIYRTGDMGKWLPDGTIEYCGRVDNQVKIRGFRIELGEIESVMQGFPGIERMAVTDILNPQGEKELAMYIVAPAAVNSTAIRRHLAAHLPVYMIPGHIIQLAEMPLTPNGKLDKKALQQLKGLETQSDTVYEAPGNELEAGMVKIWEEILDKDRIGVNDNFFEVGGNSIKIIRLAKQLSHALGKEIAVAVLFQYPSIKALAGYLESGTVSVEVQEDFDREQLLSDLDKFN